MRIKSLSINNFRSIVKCDFEINNLLALVGKNNCGKSNIIDAIEMLLLKNKAGSVYDFNHIESPIEITATFNDLTIFEKGKLKLYLEGDNFVLKKVIKYKMKENGEPDSDGKMYYVKDKKDHPTQPQNIFTGQTLPEFYKVPAVKELKEEAKIVGTTYFGKFLDLVFESDDYDFEKLDQLLAEINKELRRKDDNAPLVKSAKEVEEILAKQFKNFDLTFKIDTPKRKDFISQMEIFANDGSDTPLSSKGHGTQRAFIFSILMLYAQKLNDNLQKSERKEKKDIIIAIEEPEIYLHPHQQRIIYSLLKTLAENRSEQIQIIYSTHSSFMVNIEDYQYLGLVSKNDSDNGTVINQCLEDIFNGNDKAEFKMICQFDPERNEMFFADKIILCEGDTEKYSLPVLLNKIGINVLEKRISIVECGSKNGIPLFLKVLNKFNEKLEWFDYFVTHDLDIPAKNPKDEAHKTQLEEEARIINQTINDLIINKDKLFIFKPDFESYLKLEIGNSDKPYKARKKIQDFEKKDIPSDLSKYLLQLN